MEEVKKFDMQVYEQEKSKEKNIECNKCKNTFPLNSIKLYHSFNKNENGETMKITFFVCPFCNEVYVVNINDNKSKEYLCSIQLLQRKIEIRKKMGRKVDEKLINKFITVKANYVSYQKMLIKKYDSCITLKRI
jgi:hypothetical protein